jgi:glyoxylase-like metal-dependent hydrolase (beta-lactamase superfamily II)
MTTTDEFISSRRIGDGEAWVIHNGTMEWTPSGFGAGQEWDVDETVLADDGRVVLGINGLIIRTPDALIVVDPNDLDPDEPMSTASLHVGPSIGDAFTALGLSAGDVTHVLITHGHADHVTGATLDGAPRFPNAKLYFPAEDWRYFVDEDARGTAKGLLHHLAPVQAAGAVELVEGDVEVTPGVTLLHAPGESRGHQIVRYESGGERLYYLGDLVHFPAEIRHIDWVGVANRDVEALVTSRKRVFDDGGPEATFVYTHGIFPGWGSITPQGDDTYRWRYQR